MSSLTWVKVTWLNLRVSHQCMCLFLGKTTQTTKAWKEVHLSSGYWNRDDAFSHGFSNLIIFFITDVWLTQQMLNPASPWFFPHILRCCQDGYEPIERQRSDFPCPWRSNEETRKMKLHARCGVVGAPIRTNPNANHQTNFGAPEKLNNSRLSISLVADFSLSLPSFRRKAMNF